MGFDVGGARAPDDSFHDAANIERRNDGHYNIIRNGLALNEMGGGQ